MDVGLFDFDLPQTHIALRPHVPREQAKLLHVQADGELQDKIVADLPQLLTKGDALVFNDTKVIAAQLSGFRERVGLDHPLHINLHKREGINCWRAFVRPARRLRLGDKIIFPSSSVKLAADIAEKGEGGEVLLAFSHEGSALNGAIAAIGEMPLPPYIAAKRAPDAQDARDYQTIFACHEGAVAAPTAGLHFTQTLLDNIKQRSVDSYFVTLHVSAGTFLPVKALDTKEHNMHAERGEISAKTAKDLRQIKARGGRIIAVGTTALRALESACDESGTLQAWSGETDIFITPGYKFRFVDALITNFHLPRSTLFMLVSAFSGLETMQRAYQHAIKQHYRFYSYGDTSFLECRPQP